MAINEEKLTQFQENIQWYRSCGFSRGSAFRAAARHISNRISSQISGFETISISHMREVIFNEMD